MLRASCPRPGAFAAALFLDGRATKVPMASALCTWRLAGEKMTMLLARARRATFNEAVLGSVSRADRTGNIKAMAGVQHGSARMSYRSPFLKRRLEAPKRRVMHGTPCKVKEDRPIPHSLDAAASGVSRAWCARNRSRNRCNERVKVIEPPSAT